jgi:CrcB protein
VTPDRSPGRAALPVDPDTGAVPFARRRARWPRFAPGVLAAVFAGGAVGGLARYAATSVPHATAGGFPWATLAVNVAGAFVLALVVVFAVELTSSRYLRPLLGTGFCGGFTTFSSVVVTADRQVAAGRAWLAGGYLGASMVGALAAAVLGLVVARAVVRARRGQGGGA